jgi:hypothetical protein
LQHQQSALSPRIFFVTTYQGGLSSCELSQKVRARDVIVVVVVVLPNLPSKISSSLAAKFFLQGFNSLAFVP